MGEGRVRGKGHIEILGDTFPGETPAGAAILVAKVRSGLNIRFQGSTPPAVLFTDCGQGFSNIDDIFAQFGDIFGGGLGDLFGRGRRGGAQGPRPGRDLRMGERNGAVRRLGLRVALQRDEREPLEPLVAGADVHLYCRVADAHDHPHRAAAAAAAARGRGVLQQVRHDGTTAPACVCRSV